MQDAYRSKRYVPTKQPADRDLRGGPNSPARLVSRVAILSRLFKKYDWIISQSYAPCNALPPLAPIKTDNIRMPA